MRIDDHDDDIGILHRCLRLVGDRRVNAFRIRIPATGVLHPKTLAIPVGEVAHAVAGHAGVVLDNSFTTPQETVHQRGLTDIRTADDRDRRQRFLDVAVGINAESLADFFPLFIGVFVIAFFVVFVGYPITQTILIGFQRWNAISAPEWIGLANYRHMLGTVMQDDTLFAGSISDNISFFDPMVDMQRVYGCAQLAAIAPRLGDHARDIQQSSNAVVAQAADDEWHDLLMSASPNGRLKRLICDQKLVVHRYEHAYLSDPSALGESAGQHTRIADAIAAGDIEEACRELDRNWLTGMERLIERINGGGAG